jgi:hypothetical protein
VHRRTSEVDISAAMGKVCVPAHDREHSSVALHTVSTRTNKYIYIYIYTVCMYGADGREITKYTVIHGVYISAYIYYIYYIYIRSGLPYVCVCWHLVEAL